MTTVNFFDGTLIGDALLECEFFSRSVRRRVRMSRCYRDQNEASCRCAKKKNHQSARIKKAGAGRGFFFHCKWVMWDAPRSEVRDACQSFKTLSGFFLAGWAANSK